MAAKTTVADFFCGAGGFSEGFRQMGFKVVFALDKWAPARKTHALNHPDCQHPGLDCHLEIGGDIFKIPIEKINFIVPDTDVIIGSPPCVSFSLSNRGGNGEKSSGIANIKKFLQIVAVKKHKPRSRLKYWIMENVWNLSKYLEREYRFIDLGLTNEKLNLLSISGKQTDIALELDISERNILNAVDYGVPQRRKRLFCGEFPLPRRINPSGNAQMTLGHVIDCLKGNGSMVTDPVYGFKLSSEELTDHYYDTTIPRFEWEEARIKKQQGRYYGKMSFPEDITMPSRTVMATRSTISRESIILPTEFPDRFRYPTVREAASLMSFPITYLFQAQDESSKYRLVGNAVCPRVAAAIAKAILENLGMDPSLKSRLYHPDKSKLEVDLRYKPPKKVLNNRDPLRSFVEIVPNLKFRGFRVELDNNFPKRNGGHLKWRASIHHATGRRSMKKSLPSFTELNNFIDESGLEIETSSFREALKEEFEDRIPGSSVFQQQQCNIHPLPNFLTPRDALRKVKMLVDEHFPPHLFDPVHASNWKDPDTEAEYLRFDNGRPPNNKIPLRLLLALYAVAYIAELANSKEESGKAAPLSLTKKKVVPNVH